MCSENSFTNKNKYVNVSCMNYMVICVFKAYNVVYKYVGAEISSNLCSQVYKYRHTPGVKILTDQVDMHV